MINSSFFGPPVAVGGDVPASPTIFALATAPGRGGVAIVRLSGPRATEVLCAMAGIPAPAVRRLTRVLLTDPAKGEAIDRGMAVRFAAPHSFTGEDVVEFHLHGGRATTAALLEALAKVGGVRPAEAGEFSRRAFENGKLDLTAAEAIADLVAAETAAQRRQALRQMDGELGRLYEGWRQLLVIAMARLEATIDFSDEDIPENLVSEVRAAVVRVQEEVSRHLADGRRGERLRDGLTVAIIGPPNVGKSSLLNRLAQRDVAIVSEIAGTTRDVIEVRLDLAGYPVTVADTAGLRDSVDAIEIEGVRRARERARQADLLLLVVDADTDPAWARGVMDRPEDTILVINKCDLGIPAVWSSVAWPRARHRVSARTGDGLDGLVDGLSRLAERLCGLGDSAALTRTRHRAALEETLAALQRFEPAGGSDLAAEELRLAARALGRITGRVDVEEILDAIFREFCIGK